MHVDFFLSYHMRFYREKPISKQYVWTIILTKLWVAWFFSTNVPNFEISYMWTICILSYNSLFVYILVSCLFTFLQIELDLLRTLPNNKHYDNPNADGIPKLRRVLLAYSVHNPDVEYCQVNFFVKLISRKIIFDFIFIVKMNGNFFYLCSLKFMDSRLFWSFTWSDPCSHSVK